MKFDGSCLKQGKITFTHGKTVDTYIAYEINLWNYVGSSDPILANSLFGAVELVKNADIDKYKYSGYGIGFDVKGTFSFPAGGFAKNCIIFCVDMSFCVDATLAAEKNYSINFTVNRNKFCLSLHYNGTNS